MNKKQGEHLDQRIRQSLASLPDGPPPGSLFDSARLWEQLRPELTAQPVVTKKRVSSWWLAAASVIGLLVGVWWFQPFLSSPDTQSARRGPAPSQTTLANPANKRPVRIQTEDKAPNSISGNSSVENRNQTVHRIKSSSSVVPENQVRTGQQNWPDSPTEYQALTQMEQPVLPESTSQSIPISAPKPAVAAVPKHRFRVVHENELPAEDEAYRVRYANDGRTERFVRLGTGSRTMSASDQELPGLMLPLNRKSAQ